MHRAISPEQMLAGLVLGGTRLDGARIEPAQHLAAGRDFESKVHMEGIFALHLFLDDVVGRDRVIGPRLSVPGGEMRGSAPRNPWWLWQHRPRPDSSESSWDGEDNP